MQKLWFWGICTTLLLISYTSFAQSKGKLYKQYLFAKQQIDTQNYGSAMTVFEPLLVESKNNIFIEYAHYFYALAALRQNQTDKAEQTLKNLLSKAPNWNNLNEAYYLMVEILIVQQQPDESLEYVYKIQNPELKTLGERLVGSYLVDTDLATLRWLHQEMPEDKIIGQFLVDKLAVNAQTWEDIEEMNALVEQLALQKPEKQRIAFRTYFKENYTIAVILPLQIEAMRSGDKDKLSELSVEMYQGIRLAHQDLKNKEGITVKLLVYDISRNDTQKLQNYIESGEFEQVDFIIGPVFANQFDILANYAQQKQINILNPIGDNAENMQNPYSFLYKPTLATQALQSAKFLLNKTQEKNVIIFYDNLEKNKLLAEAHQQAVTNLGGSVLIYEEIGSGNAEDITTFLRNIGKDNICYIFASTTSQTVAEQLLQTTQALSINSPILTLDAWRTFQDMDIDQLEKQQVFFISPDYINPQNTSIDNAYVTLAEISPTQYAYIGYDVFYFVAKMLKKYGVKNSYQHFFAQQPAQKGIIVPGFDFQNKPDNQFVPLLEYQNGQLTLINEIR